MTTRFIGCMHIDHGNIIEFDRRPWASTLNMNTQLKRNWNRVVKPEDTTYIVGDFAFGPNPAQHLKDLNGKIRIIRGNHDDRLYAQKEEIEADPYTDVLLLGDIYTVKGVADKSIVLCHYAMEAWLHKDRTYHIHAHTHPHFDPTTGLMDPSPGLRSVPNRFNVGMGGLFHGQPAEKWRPLTLGEIKERHQARDGFVNVSRDLSSKPTYT